MITLNRSFRLLSSLLLTTSATICIGQAGDGSQSAARPHTVGGQVVNSVSGEPIARARVQVGQQAVLTDHDGRFELDNVTEDSAYATASKPGYFAADQLEAAQGQSITVRLIPEAILFGTISDQNGQPIQDLRVQLSMLQVHNGIRRWQTMQSTQTSVDGKYRFAELQAGQYSLATAFRLEGLSDATSSVAIMPVSFPAAREDGIRGALTLRAGDQVEANASTETQKLYQVSGVINQLAGPGIGFVENQDGEAIDQPVNIAGNTFHVKLPSGSYRIRVHSAIAAGPRIGPGDELTGTRAFSVADAPLSGVSISLQPSVVLPIEVDYQAVATNAQSTPSAPPYLNASLQDADPQGPEREFSAQPLNVPGRGPLERGAPMVFRGIEPGRYILQSHPQPPWYLASASCGNLDLMRDPLVISSGSGACTVRLVYRDDSASLKWSASAGEGGDSNQAFVMAILLDNLTHPAVESFAGSNVVYDRRPGADSSEGAFVGLAPGRYLVMALSHQQELPYRDPEALQRYMSLGQEVTRTRGGQSEADLKIVAGEP
jgi:hypothetical protein